MKRRSIFKGLLATLAFTAVGSVWAEGPEIGPISPAQAPSTGPGQVEVLEFFSYGCPHCANLDPFLRKWEQSLKKDVVVKRVPVSFGRPSWAALGRIYTTLDAMRLADKFGPQVFEAVQRSRVRLDDEKARNEWLAKVGIDVKTFNDTWRSFGVDTTTRRYEQLAVAYKIESVPTLTVQGRTRVTGEGPDAIKAVDDLIAKARSGK
ncbi:thiol:disulfide interchange protein DsbA/DsbL [Uliginosibacterium gangwonense]|uniref:thiol:disulfide interchange protein DsbA/DsbL n=1 Tax=Uliginosibacterium gangwonense TaxID=392736 RepID=UPI00037CFEE5|nr:thiol:disulfide interchange protein DsbA/DsbL [Uliginosibacterium gangwonense]